MILFFKVNILDTEKTLDFEIKPIEKVILSVNQMLTEVKDEIKGLNEDPVRPAKKKVLNNIIDFIKIKRFSDDSNNNFKDSEANIHDMVFSIIRTTVTRQKSW